MTNSSQSIQGRIAQIRRASFSASRKGFDRDEVRRYLNALADWLEEMGLGEPGQGELRRELAWVGERTSEILTKAEETAREMRDQAAADAGRLRSEVAAEAERLRSEAEEEGRRAQAEANARAEETMAEAERRAEEMIEHASRRRQDLQALIGDLIDRRDEIVAGGNRLVDELSDLLAMAGDEEPEEEEEAVEEQPEPEAPEAEEEPEGEPDADEAPEAEEEPETEEQSLRPGR